MQWTGMSSRLALLATVALCAFPALIPAQTSSWPRLMKPLDQPIQGVKVRLGNEVLLEEEEHLRHLRGKRVGLITNPSGIDSRFEPTIDKLFRHKDIKLTALFAPEHGLRGAQGAGESVVGGRDPVTSVTVYSLHGTAPDGTSLRRPTKAAMDSVDVLLYDIQDIGNRSYTYIGSLIECMVAAREAGKPVVILDRPNPMGGTMTDGNVLDPSGLSLVGWAPVPYLYGLTPGEVAKWLNEELETTVSGKAKQRIQADLHVVPMEGWKRSMKWWDTGLPWIPTSTHMQNAAACWHIAFSGYMGELRSISEGVGFPAPFEYVGAPFIDGVWLANSLNERNLPGVVFRPVQYRPYYASFEGEMVNGVQAIITDFDAYRPVEAGLHMAELLVNKYPDEDLLLTESRSRRAKSRASMFDKVMGDKTLRKRLADGEKAADIAAEWKAQREAWQKTANKYLIYK